MKIFKTFLLLTLVAILQLLVNFPFGCERKNEITNNNDNNDPLPNSSFTFTIRDWQIYSGKVFDLGRQSDFEPGDSIKTLIVYRFRRTSQPDTTGDSAIMYVDPTDTSLYANENSEVVNVKVIDSGEYDTQMNIKTNIPQIIFRAPYAGVYGGYIGYYMEILRGDSTLIIGDTLPDPMILKLIYRKNSYISQVTWNYMWRNVYYLRTSSMDYDSLHIDIFKGPRNTEISGDNLDNQNGVPYIQILGLDQYNLAGDSTPDGLTDVHTPIIDSIHRMLIFPDRQPFDPTIHFLDDTLNMMVPEIYYYTPSHPYSQQASQYYLKVSFYKFTR